MPILASPPVAAPPWPEAPLFDDEGDPVPLTERPPLGDLPFPFPFPFPPALLPPLPLSLPLAPFPLLPLFASAEFKTSSGGDRPRSKVMGDIRTTEALAAPQPNLSRSRFEIVIAIHTQCFIGIHYARPP
jgi:hypothetical protein